MQLPDVKHLIAAAVAAAGVAIAMAGGGFEPTAFAAAGLVVWVACRCVGLAVGIAPRSQTPNAAWATGAALAAFAALLALSLAWSSDDGHAIRGRRPGARLPGHVRRSSSLASRRAEARPWLVGLAIGLTAIAAIALLARFEPSLVRQPRRRPRPEPARGARPAHLPDRILERPRRGDGRGDRPADLVRRRLGLAMVAVAGGRRAAGGDAGALDHRLARRDHRRGDRNRDPGRDRPGALAAARQPRRRGRRRRRC